MDGVVGEEAGDAAVAITLAPPSQGNETSTDDVQQGEGVSVDLLLAQPPQEAPPPRPARRQTTGEALRPKAADRARTHSLPSTTARPLAPIPDIEATEDSDDIQETSHEPQLQQPQQQQQPHVAVDGEDENDDGGGDGNDDKVLMRPKNESLLAVGEPGKNIPSFQRHSAMLADVVRTSVTKSYGVHSDRPRIKRKTYLEVKAEREAELKRQAELVEAERLRKEEEERQALGHDREGQDMLAEEKEEVEGNGTGMGKAEDGDFYGDSDDSDEEDQYHNYDYNDGSASKEETSVSVDGASNSDTAATSAAMRPPSAEAQAKLLSTDQIVTQCVRQRGEELPVEQKDALPDDNTPAPQGDNDGDAQQGEQSPHFMKGRGEVDDAIYSTMKDLHLSKKPQPIGTSTTTPETAEPSLQPQDATKVMDGTTATLGDGATQQDADTKSDIAPTTNTNNGEDVGSSIAITPDPSPAPSLPQQEQQQQQQQQTANSSSSTLAALSTQEIADSAKHFHEKQKMEQKLSLSGKSAASKTSPDAVLLLDKIAELTDKDIATIGQECLLLQTEVGTLRSELLATGETASPASTEGAKLPSLSEQKRIDADALQQRVDLLKEIADTWVDVTAETEQQKRARLLHERIMEALEKMRKAQEEHEYNVETARLLREQDKLLHKKTGGKFKFSLGKTKAAKPKFKRKEMKKLVDSVTEETPVYATGITYKSLTPKDKLFLPFQMQEEIDILSVDGTPDGMWISRNKEGKVGLIHTHDFSISADYVTSRMTAYAPAKAEQSEKKE